MVLQISYTKYIKQFHQTRSVTATPRKVKDKIVDKKNVNKIMKTQKEKIEKKTCLVNQLYKAGVLNHRAADRYRSVAQSVPGSTRIN